MQFAVKGRCFYSLNEVAAVVSNRLGIEISLNLWLPGAKRSASQPVLEEAIDIKIELIDLKKDYVIDSSTVVLPAGEGQINVTLYFSTKGITLKDVENSISISATSKYTDKKDVTNTITIDGKGRVLVIPSSSLFYPLRKLSWLLGAAVVGGVIAHQHDSPLTYINSINKVINNVYGIEPCAEPNIFYIMLFFVAYIALIASLVERVLEVLVASIRKPNREILEAVLADAERAAKTDRKNVPMRELLFRADVNLSSYKNTTRTRTLAIGFVLGCGAATVLNIPLLQKVTGLVNNSGIASFNIIVIGLLVAGGAEPLHKIVSGFISILGKLKK